LNYFKAHPAALKAALLANHIFRAASMTTLSKMLPFSTPLNTAICFSGSLFYRLTVETHCAYKFALPAFAGSLAFLTAQRPIVDLISGVAFASLSTLIATLSAILPLTAYFSYIALTINYDVDNQHKA
jgi:hypothetical protein